MIVKAMCVDLGDLGFKPPIDVGVIYDAELDLWSKEILINGFYYHHSNFIILGDGFDIINQLCNHLCKLIE